MRCVVRLSCEFLSIAGSLLTVRLCAESVTCSFDQWLSTRTALRQGGMLNFITKDAREYIWISRRIYLAHHLFAHVRHNHIHLRRGSNTGRCREDSVLTRRQTLPHRQFRQHVLIKTQTLNPSTTLPCRPLLYTRPKAYPGPWPAPHYPGMISATSRDSSVSNWAITREKCALTLRLTMILARSTARSNALLMCKLSLSFVQ